MSALIEWRNEFASTRPRCTGRLPKKPVVWIGEIWLDVPGGERDIRAFRSNSPMTHQHVQTVLGQLLDQLIGEHGKDSAMSSGFSVRSR